MVLVFRANFAILNLGLHNSSQTRENNCSYLLIHRAVALWLTRFRSDSDCIER